MRRPYTQLVDQGIMPREYCWLVEKSERHEWRIFFPCSAQDTCVLPRAATEAATGQDGRFAQAQDSASTRPHRVDTATHSRRYRFSKNTRNALLVLIESFVIRKCVADTGKVDPSLAERQRMLKRARLADSLNDQLSHRPGPLELIQKNILHTDENVERAVKGQYRYSRQSSVLDAVLLWWAFGCSPLEQFGDSFFSRQKHRSDLHRHFLFLVEYRRSDSI